MISIKKAELKIGEVAAHSGVSIDSLRYYERLGLLPRARRSAGGFRLFSQDSIERVLFIKQAQELGLSLDEIKGLLATGGAAECKRVRDLLQTKIEELDVRARAMKEFRRTLARHLSECESELKAHGQAACCPVVTSSRQRK